MQINSKVFKTSTFRLAAIYLMVFALSVGAILAYVFWNTVGLMESQINATIRAEVQAMADQYRLFGVKGVVATIERRSREPGAGLYYFTDSHGRRIAGNLNSAPPYDLEDAGWVEFPLEAEVGSTKQRRSARAFHAVLNQGYELVVGRDVEELHQFGLIIRRTLIGAIGFALVLGLGGGWLMSRNFLRRVDAITDISRTIMAGTLSQRMPIFNTGDELDRLALSLNEMLDQIERLMLGMKEVSSNVAHDLKTPLTRLRARAESALRSKNPEDYRYALETTIEESDRLLETFNALLSIARAESGQAREMFTLLDASEILADVAELYEPIVEEENGSLTLRRQSGLWVKGDGQLLAQTLSNLISNAIKYGATPNRPNPQITLSGSISNNEVVLAVSDHGPGIPPSDRIRVLERFVRLDSSRSKPGNGLGLSLVAGVVRLHNGTLVLEDNHPGLCAKLKFPLAVPPREKLPYKMTVSR